MKTLAPIALFAYNRPWHTEQTLRALKANELAADSRLYIFCDGPRPGASPQELEAIDQVRTLAKAKRWCGEVTVVEAPANKGLAASIMDGVTQLCEQYGKVIVLEDDIATSHGFLRYMNEALDIYAQDGQVMHISGYLHQYQGAEKLPETFFLHFMACWGWATWQRAWQQLERDPVRLLEQLKAPGRMREMNLDGAIAFDGQLRDNISGKIRTWAIRWFATISLKRGLCLYPRRSLVQNIGMDGSGENSGELFDNIYATRPVDYIQVRRVPLLESAVGRAYVRGFYLSHKGFSLRRLLRKVRNKLRKMLGI